MREPRSILITGASSGIGAALARGYARPGTTLALGGRDPARLEDVAEQCRAAGATASWAARDVADRAGLAAWIAGADAAAPLDLVIANAGISAGTGGAGESPVQARRILAVNIDGVFNTLHPAIAHMIARPRPPGGVRGQLAIVSSLAAFRGFPGAPAYSASKAAVKAYGEALRGDLAPCGILVSVVCPGFVASPMTARNRFFMPFRVTAPRAAAIIARGLAGNRARIAFPWPLYAGAWIAGALPPALIDRVLVRLPKKSSERPEG